MMQSNKSIEKTLDTLIKVLHGTCPEEMTCDELLDMVGPYADALASGKTPPAGCELLERHLNFCPQCHEEFDALLKALRSTES